MRIERQTQSSAKLLAGVNRLLPQLNPTIPPASAEHLERLVASPSVYFLAAWEDGELTAMLTLIVTRIPSGFHGYIEDVVVDADYRGRGIAEQLVQAALTFARDAGAGKVDLTSSPSREAANRLYLRIGFERRGTNVYRYRLR